MSAKKKSPRVLFTPYLDRNEDLLWLGMPQKNPYLSFRFDADALKNFQVSFFVISIYFYSIYMLASLGSLDEQIAAVFGYDAATSVLASVVCLLFLSAMIAFFDFGKVYYAITTKRLLILRRFLGDSLNASALKDLPDFSLQSLNDEFMSISLRPVRNVEADDAKSLKHFARQASRLEELSPEEAEIAYDLLEAGKNDMLEQYNSVFRLMD